MLWGITSNVMMLFITSHSASINTCFSYILHFILQFCQPWINNLINKELSWNLRLKPNVETSISSFRLHVSPQHIINQLFIKKVKDMKDKKWYKKAEVEQYFIFTLVQPKQTTIRTHWKNKKVRFPPSDAE